MRSGFWQALLRGGRSFANMCREKILTERAGRIKPMTRTQAIVFDMDGVLIDSEELHAHAKRIAFAHGGIALSEAYLLSYVGRSDAVMIDEIGVRCGLADGQISTVLNEKTRIYEQEEQGIKIVPGAIEF